MLKKWLKYGIKSGSLNIYNAEGYWKILRLLYDNVLSFYININYYVETDEEQNAPKIRNERVIRERGRP